MEDYKAKLTALNKRMNDVEESLRVHKIEQEKLLNAEITERLSSHKVNSNHLSIYSYNNKKYPIKLQLQNCNLFLLLVKLLLL